MATLQWSARFEIDHKAIDEEHQNWIKIANRILETDPQDKGGILQALQELGAYTRKHFANEERLLDDLAYDRLEIQRLKHQVILAEMRYTIENVPELDRLHDALSRLIHEWVQGHILGEDILIKRYL